MVGGVDCLLQWRGGTAGRGASIGDLRVSMPGLICCELGRAANMRMCARAKEVEGGQKEGGGLTRWRQNWRNSVAEETDSGEKFRRPGGISGSEKEGEGRGDHGAFK
jgi:hypothetical protein